MPAKVRAEQIDTTDGTISTVNAGDAASEGTGEGVSRRDHQHAVATGAASGTVEVGDVGAEGVSSDLARADHIHPVGTPGVPADVTKAAASAGTAVVPAREDHKHDISTSAAVELTDSTNAEGAATSLARSNHTHAHGNRSGGTLHAAATTVVNGFMSAADKLKLDAMIDPRYRDPKDAVRLLATGNVSLTGAQTVDGVLTSTGDRVACFSQSTGSQDGIYVAAAGAWSRAADYQSGDDASGTFFPSEEGTANADKVWLCTNDEGSAVIGTDTLTLAQIGAGSPRGAGAGLVLNGNDLDVTANADGSITVNTNDIQVGVINDTQHGTRSGGTLHADVIAGGADGFMTGADKTKLDGIDAGAEVNPTENVEELTTQTITNSDTALTDTLTNTPLDVTKVAAYLNGVKQLYGAGNDYTVSGTSLTWLASSGTAVNMKTTDTLEVVYTSA